MQFPVVEKRKVQTADDRILAYDVVSSVEVRFKTVLSHAVVLPGDNEPFIGCYIFRG